MYGVFHFFKSATELKLEQKLHIYIYIYIYMWEPPYSISLNSRELLYLLSDKYP